MIEREELYELYLEEEDRDLLIYNNSGFVKDYIEDWLEGK